MESTFDISSINHAKLDQYRLETDPTADDVVNKIISSGFEEKINEVFRTLVQNDTFTNDTFSGFDPELAPIITNYFQKTSELPDWVDQKLIKAGEEVFSIYGPEIFMLLNVSSLPLCYTCAKGAQVLYDTGRLLSHNSDVDPLARRLMETAQMIINVLSPGGLSPNGKGVVTIQKVRLIHAAIRYYIKKGKYNNKPWELDILGEPINQEDLTGTLMSFGPVILSGLEQLNIKLSTSQIEAYMHCWKVVGHLMGIQNSLLPDSYNDGFMLATKILNHQSEESEAGKALSDSCIQFIKKTIPGSSFDEVPAFFMEFFLSDFSKSSGIDLAACIGVNNPSDRKDKIILSISKYVVGKISHLEHSELIQKITPVFNKILLQSVIHHYNGGKNVHFFIPPSLQKDWGMIKEWDDFLTVSPNIMGNRLNWQKKSEEIN